jgi:hypothetical protein
VSFWDDVVTSIEGAISDVDAAASKAISAAEALASGQVLDALEDIEDAGFDAANAAFGTEMAEVTQLLHAIGQPVETIGMGLLASMDPGEQVGSTINDVMTGNWRAIVEKVEQDVQYVPILGQAAANVIASGLALYDQLTTPNGRAKAILLAYDYALANVPGLSAFESELDPIVKAIVRIAIGGESPTDAILDALVQSLPDPLAQSAASALVLLLTHRQTILQTGMTFAGNLLSGGIDVASIPVLSQAQDVVQQLIQEGKDAVSALDAAFDSVIASVTDRENWDDFRADYKALAATCAPLPEEIVAFAQSHGLPADLVTGALNAAQTAIGAELGTTEARLKRMLAASRPYAWALAIEAKGTSDASDVVDQIVSANALLPVASRALASDIYGAAGVNAASVANANDPSQQVYAVLTAAENARPLLVGTVGGKLIPAGKQAIDAFASILGVQL